VHGVAYTVSAVVFAGRRGNVRHVSHTWRRLGTTLDLHLAARRIKQTNFRPHIMLESHEWAFLSSREGHRLMFVHFVIVNIHSRTRSLMSNCRAWNLSCITTEGYLIAGGGDVTINVVVDSHYAMNYNRTLMSSLVSATTLSSLAERTCRPTNGSAYAYNVVSVRLSVCLSVVHSPTKVLQYCDTIR